MSLYRDESKAIGGENVFSYSCFLPGKIIVILVFPVIPARVNQR